MSRLPTVAGTVTRGEVFSKLLHHLEEAQDMCATLSHLHNTEDSEKDRALARGWLMCSEMMKRARENIITLAKGTIQ